MLWHGYTGHDQDLAAMNPIDCPFHLTPEGVWVCPQCGHEYPRPSDRPPRRNCPKAPGWEESLRNHVLARLADKRELGLCELSDAQTTARLDACQKCPQFTGRVCGRIRGCDAAEKWITRLASGNCERWGESTG